MTDEPHKAPSTAQASDTETIIAFSGPAIFANRVFATIMPGAIRISFIEQTPGELAVQEFRAAVVLTIPDALAFQALLGRALEGIRVDIAPPTEPQKDA